MSFITVLHSRALFGKIECVIIALFRIAKAMRDSEAFVRSSSQSQQPVATGTAENRNRKTVVRIQSKNSKTF